MNCMQTQGKITLFINNKLNIKELEEFIDHIDTCADCREELEVYYALLTAMKQLDEDRNLSEDFVLELKQKLEKARERVIHAKYTYYRKKTILVLVMIVLAFIFGIRYAYKEQEMERNKIESNFHLRMTFRDGRNKYIEERLDQYLKEHGLEKITPSGEDVNGRKEEP